MTFTNTPCQKAVHDAARKAVSRRVPPPLLLEAQDCRRRPRAVCDARYHGTGFPDGICGVSSIGASTTAGHAPGPDPVEAGRDNGRRHLHDFAHECPRRIRQVSQLPVRWLISVQPHLLTPGSFVGTAILAVLIQTIRNPLSGTLGMSASDPPGPGPIVRIICLQDCQPRPAGQSISGILLGVCSGSCRKASHRDQSSCRAEAR